MSGFRKAKAEQAALKIGMYGPSGSGKTYTSLLCAEGIARMTGKRVAYVDTERGTDFYAQDVPERTSHPSAFDFDALYTRSLTEAVKECRAIDPREHCCLIVDSITHLWEAAIAAYGGNKTRAQTIPMHAWGSIKRPYKELMAWMLGTPIHVFILGRQGNEYGEDDQGELKNLGVKMKAEGETAYEPHILIRLEPQKPNPRRIKGANTAVQSVPTAFVEKDRTGVLHGKVIEWPSYESLIKPVWGLLGDKQASIAGETETAAKDADALAEEERMKEHRSKHLLGEFRGRFLCAKDKDAVAEVEKAITPAVKREMLTAHVNELRDACAEARQRVTTTG